MEQSDNPNTAPAPASRRLCPVPSRPLPAEAVKPPKTEIDAPAGFKAVTTAMIESDGNPEAFDQAVKEYVDRLKAFSKGDNDACPQCGQLVRSIHKRGRSYFLQPCNHKLWTGGVCPERFRNGRRPELAS